MFWIKDKKNRSTPASPSFSAQKWGLRGYTFHGHVFPDVYTKILVIGDRIAGQDLQDRGLEFSKK